MHVEPDAQRLPPPAVRGGIDVAQGVYGERGNLELIAPEAEDGFVVLWFNGDDVDQHRGAVRRAWSGALHVRTGRRVDAARIAQVPFGPDFLEVALLAGREVERWIWTPAAGFESRGAIGPSECSPSSPVAFGDELHLLVADGGRVVHLATGASAYPEAAWVERAVLDAPAPVTDLDLVSADGGLVAQALVGASVLRWSGDGRDWSGPGIKPGAWCAARIGDPGGPPVAIAEDGSARVGAAAVAPHADAVAAVRSTLDGGTLEIVVRDGTELRHARLSPDPEVDRSARPVRPLVWPPAP